MRQTKYRRASDMRTTVRTHSRRILMAWSEVWPNDSGANGALLCAARYLETLRSSQRSGTCLTISSSV